MIPNPLYLTLRILRRITPHGIARRILANDYLPPKILVDGAMEYLSAANDLGIKISGSSIAEFGPGAYNPASIIFLTRGASKVSLIEPYAKIRNLQLLRNRIIQMVEKLSPFPEMIINPDNFIDTKGYYGKVRQINGHAEATSLPDKSVDLLVSRSVMEHITNPVASVKEQARIIKTGGTFIHFIDLRDHIFKWPLEMLTVSKFIWEKILTSPVNGAGFQNRLRGDDWYSLFAGNGFTNIKVVITDENIHALRRIKNYLHDDFAKKTEENLKAFSIRISGTRL